LLAIGHVEPAAQDTHVPTESQTLSCPHDPPAGMFIFVSLQVGIGPEQSSLPRWHALVGVHASPVAQGLQTPSWQTMPAPQAVPFCLLSVSVQTGEPVEQLMVPTRQGLLATSQGVPTAHA
jgi:hypothetical protein